MKPINQLREEASKFLSREMCEALISAGSVSDLAKIEALLANEVSLASVDSPWLPRLEDASIALEEAAAKESVFDAQTFYRNLRDGAMEDRADIQRESR